MDVRVQLDQYLQEVEEGNVDDSRVDKTWHPEPESNSDIDKANSQDEVADLYNVVSTEFREGEQDTNWGKKDAKAQRYIVTTIDKDNIQLIMSCDSAKDMFDKLCSIYERDSSHHKSSLLQHFFNYKIGRVASGLSDLQNLSMKRKSVGHTVDDETMKGKILLSLPDRFGHFLTAWESTPKSDRTLTNLTARLFAEEERGHTSSTRLTINLISVHKITENGGVVKFTDNSVEILKDRTEITDGLCTCSNSSAKWTSRESGQDANTENESTRFRPWPRETVLRRGFMHCNAPAEQKPVCYSLHNSCRIVVWKKTGSVQSKSIRVSGICKKLKKLGKLDKRCDKLIMVGYATNGYRLWNSEKREIKLSRDVTFVESTEVSATNNSSQEMIADPVSLVDSEETSLRIVDSVEVRRNTTVLQNDVVDEPFHVFPSDQDTPKTSEMLDSLPETATEIENCSHQARVVAQGCEQKAGLDYSETFSSVVSLNTLRFLVAYAKKENMSLKQFDIKTAFLYGNLKQDVFMLAPEGFEDEQCSVVKLKKSLYGLQQTPRAWNKRFVDFLNAPNWVDGSLVISNENDKIDEFVMKLQTEFEFKITDNTEIFVGLEIENARGFINIHQESYLDQLLKTCNMDCTKPATTPEVPGTDNSEDCNGMEDVNFPNREAAGSSLYLSNRSIPDIMYAVNMASSLNTSLIDAYSYAYYSGDEISEVLHVMSSYTWGVLLPSLQKKQPIISLNTAESEFIASNECVKEVLFLKSLYKELTGEEFVNGADKLIPARTSCGDKCRLRCKSKVSEEDRKCIIKNFWQLGDITSQRQFIANSTEKIRPAHRSAVSKTVSGVTEGDKRGFHVPKDQCSECEMFKLATGDVKEQLKSSYEKHIDSKLKSKEGKLAATGQKEKDTLAATGQKEKDKLAATGQKEKDKLAATGQKEKDKLVATGQKEKDKLAVLNRNVKLSVYNFTVYDLVASDVFCFVWDETIGKRASNEIGPCVHEVLKVRCSGKPVIVIFYSDNFCGQNINIPSITHKFFIVGHGQNEGDSVHSVIEKQKKRALRSASIVVPAQWATIIQTAKKTGNPYKVGCATHSGIYKTSYGEEFQRINIRQRSHPQTGSFNLQKACKQLPGIYEAKKMDLRKLLNGASGTSCKQHIALCKDTSSSEEITILWKLSGLMKGVEGKLDCPKQPASQETSKGFAEYSAQVQALEIIEFGAQQVIVNNMTSIMLCTVELWLKERMLLTEDTALLSRQRTFPCGNIQKGNPGSSAHTSKLDRFKNFDSTFETRVNVANETCASFTGKGDVNVILSSDDFTSRTFGYLLKSRGEIRAKFKEFKARVENETGICVKKIMTDNGIEYTSHKFEGMLKACSIEHQKTVPYTSEQGGVSERMNRTFSEKSLCMLPDARLDRNFWHLRSYSKIFKNKAQKYMMVGYPEGTKGYRLHDLRKIGKTIIDTDVEFLESSSPKNYPQYLAALEKSNIRYFFKLLGVTRLHRFEKREVRFQAGNIIVEVVIVNSRNCDNQVIVEPRFNIVDAKIVSTPLEVNCKLENSSNGKSPNVPYQSLVGCFIYLAVTSSPDIAHAASYLSQFNSNFKMEHWVSAKRVL
ncbi:hypothetical protein PR048_033153, partial [Dryococelus australis]